MMYNNQVKDIPNANSIKYFFLALYIVHA